MPVTEVIQRLRGKLAQLPGINTYLQPVQNLTVGGRQSKSQYQYTLQSNDLSLLYDWGPRLEAEAGQASHREHGNQSTLGHPAHAGPSFSARAGPAPIVLR